MANERTVFTKADLLMIKPPSRIIEPPGYKYALEIRGLNAAEQSHVLSSQLDVKYVGNKATASAKLEGTNQLICSLGVTAPKLTHAEWGQLPNNIVAFAAEEIRELSGMNIGLEEAEGNSKGAQTSS